MKNRAFWKYYFDSAIINLMFSSIISIMSGLFWGLLSFCSIGIFVGLIAFRYFKNHEYYLYYNLGYTKLKLLKNIWLINTSSAIPFLFLTGFNL